MADYPPEKAPMCGWGQVLQPLLSGEIHIQNEAVCGRSSRSFISEGRLDRIALCLRPGDRLVIGFGHNDEKLEDPQRYTSPGETFPEYLGKYIDTALEHEAVPVLVTPVIRRRFDEAGNPVPTHGTYPEAIRALAKACGIKLVDLEQATAALLRAEGEEGSKNIFCFVPAGHPNYPDGLQDNSHLHLRGAVRIARLFLESDAHFLSV